MQPSRRQVLAAIAAGAAVGLAGCAAIGDGDGEDSNDAGAASNASDDDIPRPPKIELDDGSSDDEEASSPDESAEPPTFPTEGPLEARLVGPDAEITVFERSDIEVGEVQASQSYYIVPVTVSEERGETFLAAIEDLDLSENYREYEVVVTVDGEEIRRSPIAPGLAHEWDDGNWERQFVIQSPTEAGAERLREALR